MYVNDTNVKPKPKKLKIKKKKSNKRSNFKIVETFVGCGGSHIGFDREGL